MDKHHRASNQHGYPVLDWPGNHDAFEHLDHHPLEGERQDVELYLCGLPGTRRTITLRTLIQQLCASGDSSKIHITDGDLYSY